MVKDLGLIGTIDVTKGIEEEEYFKHKVAEYKKKHPKELVIETVTDLNLAIALVLKQSELGDGFDVTYRVVCPRCHRMHIRTLRDAIKIIMEGVPHPSGQEGSILDILCKDLKR